MKKLRRVEPSKEEKKKLKVATCCRVSAKFVITLSGILDHEESRNLSENIQ